MRGQRPEPHPEQLDQSVVEGEDPVRPGLGPPQLHEFGQSLRIQLADLMAFARIGIQVIQLPVFAIELVE